MAGCGVHGDGMLAAAGEVAEIQRDQLMRITLLVLVVIAPVFIGLPLILWRDRLSRGADAYRPDWHFSARLEYFIWGVPIVIVSLLAISLWTTLHEIDPYQRLRPGTDPVRVQVVGLDWKFLFIYPDEGVASVNRLVLPEGREVAFDITADGPMMAFMIPRLGGQIYAMAGMRTKLHLIADRTGSYRGLNTQFNGSHFHEQHFAVQVRDAAGYRRWVEGARAAPPLDGARYAALARPSTVAQPMTFGRAQPGLFDHIVAKYHHAGSPDGALRGVAPTPPDHGKAAQPVPAEAMP
ncbi:COX aromatic rich motif-containing protein [Stakelama tenebrarum]|uniref:COX aromatic rich motif-containing protein n=1 Tax=Stakelama tenebrarum TaxID=2711215 RepID=UPI0019D21B82|nr:COX aromatic rich motif-containing protein [Sphingosinithalassobacter tenebrarum]